jgi:hypothetical protein
MNDDLYMAILLRVDAEESLEAREKQILAEGYTALIRNLIAKYVQGKKEHADGSLFDVPQSRIKREMRNEVLDLVHYHMADERDTREEAQRER